MGRIRVSDILGLRRQFIPGLFRLERHQLNLAQKWDMSLLVSSTRYTMQLSATTLATSDVLKILFNPDAGEQVLVLNADTLRDITRPLVILLSPHGRENTSLHAQVIECKPVSDSTLDVSTIPHSPDSPHSPGSPHSPHSPGSQHSPHSPGSPHSLGSPHSPHSLGSPHSPVLELQLRSPELDTQDVFRFLEDEDVKFPAPYSGDVPTIPCSPPPRLLHISELSMPNTQDALQTLENMFAHTPTAFTPVGSPARSDFTTVPSSSPYQVLSPPPWLRVSKRKSRSRSQGMDSS